MFLPLGWPGLRTAVNLCPSVPRDAYLDWSWALQTASRPISPADSIHGGIVVVADLNLWGQARITHSLAMPSIHPHRYAFLMDGIPR